MTHHEQSTALPGVVLWQVETGPSGRRARILPDGCMDLIWEGQQLAVAGPDTRFRWHESTRPTSSVGVRMAAGTGPALLGLPADVLRDRSPAMEDLWRAGRLAGWPSRLRPTPYLLRRWVEDQGRLRPVDPLGRRVLAMAQAGQPVCAMADAGALSVRQLHRRCSALFGYGPRHLSRVVRLGPALDRIRLGAPLAEVAAAEGYADQAHLSREVRDLAGTTPGSRRRER